MALKLNKIDKDTIREEVSANREQLEKFFAAQPSSKMRSAPAHYSERLADAALQLGLDLYQQEGDVTEIRRSFALAGKELVAVLALEQENASLSPLNFEKALAL